MMLLHGFIILVCQHISLLQVSGDSSRNGIFAGVHLDSIKERFSKTVVSKTISLPSDLACAQRCFANDKCSFKLFDSEKILCHFYESISPADTDIKKARLARKMKDACVSHNCGNKCKCVPLFETDSYICNCDAGLPKTSINHVHRTCKAALQANANATNTYNIQPSLIHGPVSVKCEMGSNGNSYAVFNHNNEAETIATGYPDHSGGYEKRFLYSTSMTTIKFVINNSVHCEQYTGAQCKGVTFVGMGSSWLIGRDGEKLLFWGGGPPNGIGCACGMSGTCRTPSRKCNCDTNDNSGGRFDEDAGNVIKKEVLPLTGIALGDLGSKDVEVVKYTIGPMKCLL